MGKVIMSGIVSQLVAPAPQSRLPAGYTELKAIRATGTQYIDWRFKPNNNTTIVADFQLTKNQCHPFGARTAFTNKAFMLFWTSNSNFTVQIGNKTFSGGTFNETARHTVSMSGTSLVIDGETKATYSVDAFQCEYNAWLMSCYSSGESEYAVGDLFSGKAYDGENLIRDSVPCINNSGEVGMYDLVTKVFFGNAGTGAFIGVEAT